MKQVFQDLRSKKVEVREVPSPRPRPGGVIVQNRYSLISTGTERATVSVGRMGLLAKARARPDLVSKVVDFGRRQGVAAAVQLVRDRLSTWQALGYSSAGVVVDAGDCLDLFKAGDRVACGGIGFASHAEVVFVPRNLCVRVPDGVELDRACFTTLGAIALQGVRQAGTVLGDVVLVVGLGLVGLLTVQLLKAAGARVVGLDLVPARLDQARRCGADGVARPGTPECAELVERLTAGRGVDQALLTASTSSSEPAIEAAGLVRDRGRRVVVGRVGMELPLSPFYEKELDIRYSRSYGPGRYDPAYEEKGRDYPIGYVRWTERRNMEAVLGAMESGAVRTEILTSHRVPIERAADAYELVLEEGGGPASAVILEYPETSARAAARGTSTAAATVEDSSATAASTAFGSAAGAEAEASPGVEFPPAPAAPPDAEVPPTTPRAGGTPPPCVVGWIGAGKFAQQALLPFFRKSDHVELRAVASAGGLSAARIGERYDFRDRAAGVDEILDDTGINTVVITTRHDSHADLVLRAIEAGKENVFVEKPLAILDGDLDRIERALGRRSGVRLLVGFNRRFAPATIRLRSELAGREAPCVFHMRVNAGYVEPESWYQDPERGGGRLLGEGCHFTDLLGHLAGAPVTSVAAAGVRDASGRCGPDDTFSCVMQFADGSVATLDYFANGPQKLPKERLEVAVGGTFYVIDDFRKLERIGPRRQVLWKGAQDKGHAAEVAAFTAAIAGGGPGPAGARELLDASRVPFRIRESMQNGEPVRL